MGFASDKRYGPRRFLQSDYRIYRIVRLVRDRQSTIGVLLHTGVFESGVASVVVMNTISMKNSTW